ncbi:MAG: ABC transporter ATP-binding protein [Acidimicrobiaceae bacterium]|nr:ABC transporter ATP-binding protein [Acidimicrobiaceae bacterium]MYH00791.1 ABC transporter ATP-binding protein [Acidimicrobiaceae bacterium]
MPALEFHEVNKTYRTGGTDIVALDHANLTVDDDEIVALLGPSGSGKTTLLSIAGGLLTPTNGAVHVGGNDITSYSAKELTQFRARSVGFVFQTVNLVPFLTARENLLVVARITGLPSKTAARRADTLLKELGLDHRAQNLPTQLSGGERQRVAIGRALMNEPELVLFDEPTSALDTSLGEQVMELIRKEVKGRETASVIVTHDTRMTAHADRTIHIVDGRLDAGAAQPA